MITETTPHLSILPASAPVGVEHKADGTYLSVPANAEVTLIEKFQHRGPDAYSTQSRICLSAAPGSKVTHYKLVLEGPHATHHSTLEAEIAKDAAFESHVFLMAGANIRNTIQVRLIGENASCVLNGLYVGGGKQVIQTHTLIEHLKPHGSSREFYKGILDDEAQGQFDGLIVVAKDAQKTDSSQVNKNLLLSARAKAQSLPELKISANDVKCKHGSTIGQLDPQQLFYLRSRGIPMDEARRVLVYAFASEMIEMVELEEIRTALMPCVSFGSRT